MALSDLRKLDLVRGAIVSWLHNFQDWQSLKTALQGLTKAQLKTFILNVIQAESDADLQASTDKSELYTEVTNDI